mgnify:CR=1 FL=1
MIPSTATSLIGIVPIHKNMRIIASVAAITRKIMNGCDI